MNKVIIITGASSGIGQATAKKLAAQGASIMLAARREDRLQQLQAEIEAAGGKASYCVTDVTSRQQMLDLATHTIEAFGRIDVLINNAGIMPVSFMNKLKVDEWDAMIDVNIKGVLYGIAAVYPHFEQQNSGHIITVASVAGHELFPGSGVYSATKTAVRFIMEGLRKEMRPDQNIRTTTICPGAVSTELTHTITDEDILAMYGQIAQQLVPLQSEDIAAAIQYAVEQPESVSVNEIIVRPLKSAGL